MSGNKNQYLMLVKKDKSSVTTLTNAIWSIAKETLLTLALIRTNSVYTGAVPSTLMSFIAALIMV